MNIQERIETLETEFNEKIKALKAEVQQEKEFPQEDDMFWFINTFGRSVWSTWGESITNRQLIEIGNMFRTKEQAEFAVEKLKVEAELRKFSRPFKEDEYNYFIQIHPSHNNIVTDSDDYYQTQGTIYFESTTIANEAIDTVGEERIKKYIFGVED